MADLLNSLVGYICVGRTCASSNSQKTVRLGACCSGDGGLKTAVGFYASWCSSGAENTAFGARALKNNTGGCNTGIGVNTLCAGTGNYNTAVGHNALKNVTNTSKSTGVGYYALKCLTSGVGNTAVGACAGMCISTGTKNTFVGYFTRSTSSSLNRTVALGTNSRVGGSYAVAIGTASYAAGNCAIAIGNGTCVGANKIKWGASNNNVCNIVWASWTYVSDCRDKTDIKDLDDNLGINLVRKLKPVTYKSDNRQSYVKLCNYDYGTKDGNLKTDKKSYGFLAQDIKDVTDELNVRFDAVRYDEDMDAYRLSYSQLLASIVKTIKTIDERIEILKTKI